MNREDTIKLARESGATPYTNRHYPERPTHTFNVEQLERFAALVAAAKEAELNDALTVAYMHGYEKGKAAGAAAEREACAKQLDEDASYYVSAGTVGHTIRKCAAAIRARGQT